MTKRQTCSTCFQTTTDYTTRTVDRRTSAEIRSGREPRISTFHSCASHGTA